MFKKKNKLNLFMTLSIGLHSLALVLISNFSQNFSSSQSSIIEVKIEKYSENNDLGKAKESLKTKQKKQITQITNNKKQSKNLKNNNSIKNIQNISQIYQYQSLPKPNIQERSISAKTSYQNTKTVDLEVFKSDYRINKKNLITKSRAEFKIGSHDNPHPEYPLIARKKGWEGRVIIHADIDNTGKVTYIKILESSGYEALDSVSLNTLKNWKFTPAKFGNKFIEDSVTIPVNFLLKD